MQFNYILAALVGYLVGSVSFSIILSKLVHKDDIRRHGSGNAGTTNTLRTYGGKTAFWVLAGDFLKGTLAVFLGNLLGGNPMGGIIAGFFVVLGHLFPAFFGLRGGKGVATAAGMILLVDTPMLFVLLVPFGLILLTTRYMSLAAVTSAVLYPIFTLVEQRIQGITLQQGAPKLVLAVLVGGLVVFMHRANIVRLLKGTESKVGQKKK